MSRSSTFSAWVRLHIFRTVTAVLTLVLLGLCFFYDPGLITWWLRTTMGMIEFVAALLPYPWGDQVEITLNCRTNAGRGGRAGCSSGLRFRLRFPSPMECVRDEAG